MSATAREVEWLRRKRNCSSDIKLLQMKKLFNQD